MTWKPLDRNRLDAMIAEGLDGADDEVCAAWEGMRIEPEKWQCSPWGDDGGGFWAVAIRPVPWDDTGSGPEGGEVVWYNDIEEGFNVSPYSTRGIIDEYSCNQSDFRDFLLSLPEATGRDWSRDGGDESVPGPATDAGEIGRRQTTSWEICVHGVRWRVHFKSKAEARFVEAQFTKLVIADDHPVLAHHHEPWIHLYVTRLEHPGDVKAAVGACVRLASGGWREPGEYVTSMDLTKGFGLFMRAPASIAHAVSSLLEDRGATVSMLDGRAAGERMRVLLMDRTFVVAKAFHFEKRP